MDPQSLNEGFQRDVQTGKKRQLKRFGGALSEEASRFSVLPERRELQSSWILAPQPKCRDQPNQNLLQWHGMGAVLRAHFVKYHLSQRDVQFSASHEAELVSLEDLADTAQDDDSAKEWTQGLQLELATFQ